MSLYTAGFEGIRETGIFLGIALAHSCLACVGVVRSSLAVAFSHVDGGLGLMAAMQWPIRITALHDVRTVLYVCSFSSMTSYISRVIGVVTHVLKQRMKWYRFLFCDYELPIFREMWWVTRRTQIFMLSESTYSINSTSFTASEWLNNWFVGSYCHLVTNLLSIILNSLCFHFCHHQNVAFFNAASTEPHFWPSRGKHFLSTPFKPEKKRCVHKCSFDF